MTFALKKIERVNCEISGRSNCFPHSWLSMVQDDLMCNAYSQSMWSSAKFPVVFLLKFGWWEVNCCRKVNTQGFAQSIVSWPAFRNNFVVYPLHFFLQRRLLITTWRVFMISHHAYIISNVKIRTFMSVYELFFYIRH